MPHWHAFLSSRLTKVWLHAQLVGDDAALNLRSAAADGEEFRQSPVALDVGFG